MRFFINLLVFLGFIIAIVFAMNKSLIKSQDSSKNFGVIKEALESETDEDTVEVLLNKYQEAKSESSWFFNIIHHITGLIYWFIAAVVFIFIIVINNIIGKNKEIEKNYNNYFGKEREKENIDSDFYNSFIDYVVYHDEDSFQLLGNINMWIVRLGIIGTLIGIMMAFIDLQSALSLYNIMASFEELKELQYSLFLTSVIFSIKGNAFAIISSLAAHSVSFFLNIAMTILSQYSLQKKILDKFNTSITKTVSNLPKIETNFSSIEKILGRIEDKMTHISEESESTLKKVEKTRTEIEIVNESFGLVDKIVTNIQLKWNNINNYAKSLSKAINLYLGE